MYEDVLINIRNNIFTNVQVDEVAARWNGVELAFSTSDARFLHCYKEEIIVIKIIFLH